MFTLSGLRVMDYAAGTAMAPHDHDEASMNIVLRGGFRESIVRGERDYIRGHVAFCPAGTTHSQRFGTSGARQVIFKPQACWLDYLKDCSVKLDDAPYAGSLVFRDLGDRLLEEMRSDDDFSGIACEGIVLEIVAAFGRNNSVQKPDANPPAWLRAARDFIHENAFISLSVARVARAAGRHEIHLAREFRRYFGMSIGAYLRRLRIERAAQLLRQPQSDISEVAMRCAFSSHSHLCREFKAHFGVTPSQYRSRNGE